MELATMAKTMFKESRKKRKKSRISSPAPRKRPSLSPCYHQAISIGHESTQCGDGQLQGSTGFHLSAIRFNQLNTPERILGRVFIHRGPLVIY